jgi:hypothetical protein
MHFSFMSRMLFQMLQVYQNACCPNFFFLALQAPSFTCLSSVSITVILNCLIHLPCSILVLTSCCKFSHFLFWLCLQICLCESNWNKVSSRWSAVAHLLGVVLVYHFVWAHFCSNTWMVNCTFRVLKICRILDFLKPSIVLNAVSLWHSPQL